MTMTQPVNVVANFQPGSVRTNVYNITAGGSGGSYVVLVLADAGCAWTFGSTASWVRLRGTAPSSGTAAVSISVDPNSTGSTRTALVSFGPATLTVTQPSN